MALVLLVLAGAAAAWFLVLRDDDETVRGPESSPFAVQIPAGWESVPADELSDVPGSPVAVLRQTGGKGIVVINREPGVSQNLTGLSRELQAKLRERFPDFELASSRRVSVEAGPALYLSYARTGEGTAHTLMVVPAGDRSYAVNSVVPAGQDEVAAEVDRILASFDIQESG